MIFYIFLCSSDTKIFMLKFNCSWNILLESLEEIWLTKFKFFKSIFDKNVTLNQLIRSQSWKPSVGSIKCGKQSCKWRSYPGCCPHCLHTVISGSSYTAEVWMWWKPKMLFKQPPQTSITNSYWSSQNSYLRVFFFTNVSKFAILLFPYSKQILPFLVTYWLRCVFSGG